MALPCEIKLSDREKLETLQRLDQFRRWRSLDDRRFCLSCGKIINGRSVRVSGTPGALHLICGTEGCDAIPMDWALPSGDLRPNAPVYPV
jgi:hypothetical protein